MLRPLVTALRTLTVLPVPGHDTADLRRSLPMFPVAAVLLCAAVGLGAVIIDCVPLDIPFVKGALLCLLLTVLTGALHVDGLADAADGFFGGRGREEILRILKDSRAGTFGVAALTFDIVLKSAVFDRLISAWTLEPLFCAILLSRTVQALTLAVLPYARSNEGTAAPFARGGKYVPVLVVELVGVVYFSIFLLWWPALAAAAAALAAAGLLWWYFMRRIGGVTGDCVGATSETAEIVFLLTAAAFW